MKIAIIGANEFQNKLVKKAKNLGIETHVFAWDEGAIAKESSDYFYPLSITEKDKILEICKKIKIDGICSIGSDLAVLTVNYIAKELNLVGNTLNSTLFSTNKYEMRKKMSKDGLPCPKFLLLENFERKFIEGQEISYPVIVKPTQLGGKRGITVANNEDELRKAVKYAQEAIGQREQKIIVEEFLNGGNEYSVEGLSFGGKHYIIQVTEKISSGAPHCVELGHRQPANISSEMRKRIEKVLTGVFDRLQLKNGASHTEIKIIDNRIYLIEINFRPGGDHIASPLTELSTGYSYIGGAIDIALGCFEKPHIEQNKQKYAGVLFVTKQTKKYEKFFNGYENEEWMYKINHVSE